MARTISPLRDALSQGLEINVSIRIFMVRTHKGIGILVRTQNGIGISFAVLCPENKRGCKQPIAILLYPSGVIVLLAVALIQCYVPFVSTWKFPPVHYAPAQIALNTCNIHALAHCFEGGNDQRH